MPKLLAPCVIICCFVPAPTLAAEPASADNLSQRVVATAHSDKFDHSLIQTIQKLPRAERPPLAIKLLKSPNSAMRHQALLILKEFPPKIAAASIRQLLDDKNPDNRAAAEQYLAKRTKDAKAWQLLLREAASHDPNVAIPAIKALGHLGGPRAAEALLAVLKDKENPHKVRHTAILVAGMARFKSCVPAFVESLDNREPSKRFRKDPARVCDLAATALENTYEIYRLGAPGAFFTATVEERDQGIAAWKAWYAAQGASPGLTPRMAHLHRVVESSLRELADSPNQVMRKRIKNRLEHAFKTRFCLGDLPGVDAVVTPSVRDLWRILQVFDEERWYRHLNTWSDLQLAFNREFLPSFKTLPTEPDAQALAFIQFARTVKSFERIWVWSFCRNFAEVFPASKHLRAIRTIRSELEAAFEAAKKQVVLHGHIAVLEPKPAPLRRGGMVPTGYTALRMQLRREPSNWPLYGANVEHFRKKYERAVAKNDPQKPPYVYDITFKQWIKLYTGNEWPYLGNAIYRWRVLKDAERAIEFANKALILNPGNAKAYAIRGMIRIAADSSLDKAEADLRHAFELDPTSLGDEEETSDAVIFLARRIIQKDSQGSIAAQLKALGRLKPRKAAQPMSEDNRFKALLNELQNR